MSFIQRFLERVLRTNTTRMPRTSFDDLNQDQLDAHLQVGRYGSFSPHRRRPPLLRAGGRPSRRAIAATCTAIPRLGTPCPSWRRRSPPSGSLTCLMDLLTPLGDEVDVVMESSHESEPGVHADLYREHMDTVILKSTLYDFESLLLNDGCTGSGCSQPERADGGPV